MLVCRTKAELKRELSELRKAGKSVGLVPTMGYLHDGHASLLRRAKEENDAAVLSVFINPMQFGPNEDLDRYPRDEQRDLKLAEQCGIDLVFMPAVQEMYPSKPLTSIIISQVTSRLCGASRPGHFDGVGLVVSKLFHLVQPDRAYFGMKDAQQVAVIEQMVNDLDLPVEIIPCPTVREPDGLALSSRNVYLTAQQRQQAVVLSQTLKRAEQWHQEPQMTAGALIAKAAGHIEEATEGTIDYVELLTFPALEPLHPDMPLSEGSGRLILALAVKFGTTRLIDNCILDLSEVNGNAANHDEV